RFGNLGLRQCTRTKEGRGAKTMSKFLKLIKNQKGATAIEYGLIAALIAVAAIGAMQGIGNKLNTTFNNVSNKLGKAKGGFQSGAAGPKGAAAFVLCLRRHCARW